jgi:hypothetical protein
MFGNENLFSPYKHAKQFGILIGSFETMSPHDGGDGGFFKFKKK